MRWYDPVTGRWLSKDPIGLSGGLNLYSFCEGDPIHNVDRIGLCTEVRASGLTAKKPRSDAFGPGTHCHHQQDLSANHVCV